MILSVLWRSQLSKLTRKRILKGLGFFVGASLAIVVILVLIPTRTPTVEGANAIASLEPVELGGVDQWLLIRGRDRSNPVLLYLHGGPGGAYMPVARNFSSRLEEHFVVVHWDQRGAGKSCTSEVPDESLNLEQYLADTLELVKLLRSRFGVEKIYLLGHSWGTVLGVLTVERHPELFHAYVGLGQVVDMRRGEDISYRFVVEHARADGNDQALEELTAVHFPYSKEELIIQRTWLDHYRGISHEGSGMSGLVRAVLLAPEYSLLEKISYNGCFMNTLDQAWDDFQDIDFIHSVPRLEVPVYFFSGRYDYTVPFELVVEWADVLEAPHVEIVWFEESAHNACLEEPDRFQDELIDRVLAENR